VPSTRASTDELQVSVVCLHDLFAVLRQQGESPEELLNAEGLAHISLADARSLVPVRCYERLVDAAFACARAPGLGLDVASDTSRGLYPLLSHFATAVPTMRAAIDMLIRYNELFVDGVRFSLNESAGVAYLRFAFHPGLASSALRFSSEMLVTLFVRLVRQVYSPDARLHELRFRHPRPSYADRYLQLFGCPVRFSDSACSIAFSAELLDCPQPRADAFVADLLREACERMLVTDAPRSSVASRVRLLLRREGDLCRVDQDAVARELGMGLRMLRRKLLREGANMSTLIDEARLDAARVELLCSRARAPAASAR
jgi:Arabinose-binding domain of AraC transcription regulator, N-term